MDGKNCWITLLNKKNALFSTFTCRIYCLTKRNHAIGKNIKNIMNIVSAEAPPGDIPSCFDACFPFFTGLKQFNGSSGLKQQSFKGTFRIFLSYGSQMANILWNILCSLYQIIHIIGPCGRYEFILDVGKDRAIKI